MIVPQEIRNREFERGLNGYDQEEVVVFQQELAEEFENLYSQNERLKDTLRQIRAQSQMFKEAEGKLDQLLDLSRHKAAVLGEEAEGDAKHLLAYTHLRMKQTLDLYWEVLQRISAFSEEARLVLQECLDFYGEKNLLFGSIANQGENGRASEIDLLRTRVDELLKGLDDYIQSIGTYIPATREEVTVESLNSQLAGYEQIPVEQEPAVVETPSTTPETPMSISLNDTLPKTAIPSYLDKIPPGPQILHDLDKPAPEKPVPPDLNKTAPETHVPHDLDMTPLEAPAPHSLSKTLPEMPLEDHVIMADVLERTRLLVPPAKPAESAKPQIPWEMPSRVGEYSLSQDFAPKKKVRFRFGWLVILALVMVLGLVGGYCWRHDLIPQLPWVQKSSEPNTPVGGTEDPEGSTAPNTPSGQETVPPLLQAVMDQDADKVEQLLAAGTSPDVANTKGETPLMVAAYHGDSKIVQALLEAGADPNIKEKEWGVTALMYAGFRGNITIAEMLLDYKADPNISNREGWTALMCAAFDGHPKTVQMLIKRGADPYLETVDGWTAYELALLTERELTAKAMENAGVKPTEIGGSGQKFTTNEDMLRLFSKYH